MDHSAGADAAVIDTNEFIEARDDKDLLRFITCGATGAGKSALIDRLLSESKTGGRSARPADGLQAEHKLGTAIDVTHHIFETEKRKFVAADAPGHEQYTRNMATGASTADLAVVLVDAREGVVTQTRRHSHIISLLGVRQVVLAVNKMDLVDYDQAVFDGIVADYTSLAGELGIEELRSVPLSALTGENIFEAGGAMPWFDGPPLMEVLETVEFDRGDAQKDFRLPVEKSDSSNPDIRGFSGTVASGQIERGTQVVASLSGKATTVERILGPSGDLQRAVAGQSVTLVLADEFDIGQGDVIAEPGHLPEVADQFAAHLIWMDSEAMLPERTYVIRLASATATVQVTDLVHRVDVNTLEHLAAKTLELNEVGYCKIAVDRAVCFDAHHENRHTGAFTLIDKFTNATVAVGVIDFALRRASNIAWHDMKVDKAVRAKANAQEPCILWFTGLSGAGKSTIADRLEQKLHALGKRTYLLDGDNVRHGLNKDLGFTDQDRVENIRRVAEVAKLIMDAGLIVLVSFISPFRSERQMARALMEEGEFIEIFVDTPLEVCEDRDPKGLYKKARAGELKNFTGIDSDYEIPLNAEITLRGGKDDVETCVDRIIEHITNSGPAERSRKVN